MEVANRQQVRLAIGKPSPRGRTLTLRAVPVAAGVVGDTPLATVLAGFDMPPSAAVRQFSIADMTLS